MVTIKSKSGWFVYEENRANQRVFIEETNLNIARELPYLETSIELGAGAFFLDWSSVYGEIDSLWRDDEEIVIYRKIKKETEFIGTFEIPEFVDAFRKNESTYGKGKIGHCYKIEILRGGEKQ